ncbi:MAG TPA: EAL domain-containing protein [Solirubrobacteraceae bacterium]|jgi:diguanylate cyclase (GGDEF)-like protein|nr:EAL domain-containing protein [Solirubrobacteraceae bacterium]
MADYTGIDGDLLDARALPVQPRADQIGVAILQWAGLAGAVVVVALTAGSQDWNPGDLAIIAALTILSEATSVLVGSRRIRVSGSFLGLMLAAVLLGGGPAAVVGVMTIGVGWFRSHEAPHHLRNNLFTYAWFPLLSGLIFHAFVTHHGLDQNQPGFYLAVFGIFVLALLLNIAMAAAYLAYLDPPSFLGRFWEILKPILAPELAANLLTLAAVYLATHLHQVGLALFAIVLVVFQYLVGELLVSQRRGEELQKLATTDELTSLANRSSFADRLAQEIETCKQTGESFGVFLIDLDRFKEINDTLGHQNGDLLLQELAPRIAEHVGPGGLVARFGGGDFAVLTGVRTESPESLERIAADLIACVQQPVTIDDITLEVGCNAGVSRFPKDGEDAETLLRRMDIAINAAKQHHEAYRLYDPAQDHYSPERLRLVGDFRRGLHAEEIVVHYQPIVDLHTQRVSGAESLVRWQHPSMGLLYPDKFLSTVEQTALIGPLTRHVLDRSIAQCIRWRESGLDLTVAVNLSVRNLSDPRLPEDVERMLRRHGLPPEALQLEITESMIMSDPERALATVNQLNQLGVRLAVDDFGTGHSSLANLRRLPIDELKIDRSFVTPMLNDENDLIIVRSTINMAHDLGLKTIAEGVEDASTLSELDDLGCDQVQGYHFSKPVPADAFMSWADAFQSAHVRG